MTLSERQHRRNDMTLSERQHRRNDMTLSERQRKLCEASPWDFSDHLLNDAGGIPAHGNQRSEWDAGCRFDFDNPAYR
jgi:hypothetical protein